MVLLCSPSSKFAVLCNLMQYSQCFLGFLIEMEKILNSEIGNNFA